jgi:hypothetical protein
MCVLVVLVKDGDRFQKSVLDALEKDDDIHTSILSFAGLSLLTSFPRSSARIPHAGDPATDPRRKCAGLCAHFLGVGVVSPTNRSRPLCLHAGVVNSFNTPSGCNLLLQHTVKSSLLPQKHRNNKFTSK